MHFQKIFLSLRRLILVLCIVGAFTSCANESSREKYVAHSKVLDALNQVKQSNWIIETISPSVSNSLALFSARKQVDKNLDLLTIYIEGDGRAWEGSYPSSDPTPSDPIALRMALGQPVGNVAYLARPCQYIDLKENTACRTEVWSDERFSPRILDAMQNGVEQLKLASGAKRLTLVGYSGGGTFALLLAAHRNDVANVTTVAGNLDVQAWLTYHHLPPMKDVLNPVDYIAKLQSIPQTHFVGGKDEITPASITYQYASQFPSSMRPRIIVEANYGHACCWADVWPKLHLKLNQP